MTRRTGIAAVPPAGAHGGDGATVALALGMSVADVLDLSASLNPFAPDPASIVARHLAALTRYPDPSDATRSLASALDVDPATLVLTNGGAEAIALIAQIQPVGRVDEPEFALYRRHLTEITPDGPRWRSNPNNPTGQLAPDDDTAAVWDEAFYPLATGSWTRGDEDTWRVGSLTKVWACPGLRLGYLISPDRDHADAVRRLQPEWAVNGLALAAVPDLLSITDLAMWARQIDELRGAFVDGLEQRGLRADTTDVNWVLVHDLPLRDLLAPHGVVVRDCASFGLAGTTRIAVPRPNDSPRFFTALDAALDSWTPK